MVERGFGSGFHLATQARDDDMRVLQLDPDYVDAKLVVGVYEYVVGALPLPFKFLIGFAGITGSKSKGLAMLTDDGRRGAFSAARGPVQGSDSGGAGAEEGVSAGLPVCPGRRQSAQG
jgi:hypothetical protein